jgi:hypothetical protein
LKTVTAAVPAVAMSPAGTCARRPPLTVVGRSFPFQRTTELEAKFVPATYRVKVCAPTGAQPGSRELIVGMGLVPLLIAKLTPLDVPPPGPGLVTVTAAVPAEAMAAAGIVAVNCMELTNVAATAVPPKLTTEEERKFAPLTVRVNAGLPATLLVGDIVEIVGEGIVET